MRRVLTLGILAAALAGGCGDAKPTGSGSGPPPAGEKDPFRKPADPNAKPGPQPG